MCEVILVALHAINMKLFNDIPNKNSPKLCKSTKKRKKKKKNTRSILVVY